MSLATQCRALTIEIPQKEPLQSHKVQLLSRGSEAYELLGLGSSCPLLAYSCYCT